MAPTDPVAALNKDSSPDLDASRIAELADEYFESGDNSNVGDYAKRHPEFADVLQCILPALELMRESHSGGGDLAQLADVPDLNNKRLGDYRIVREIGRGGMGVVYEAEQLSLQRRVALKILPTASALDPRRLERFHREALAAARLQHGNVVHVHTVGCENNVYYYTMQLIEGPSLAELIQAFRGRTKDPKFATSDLNNWETECPGKADMVSAIQVNTARYFRQVTEWGLQAAKALEYAHSCGVIHRDIKPANLLIDDQGKLWVTDFGLARLVGDVGGTMSEGIVGTMRYMSPEQSSGKGGLIDHRSDVYSLGATLYELATLKPIFDGESREELLLQITQSDPLAPNRHNKLIPSDLETIITKCVSKEPAWRYSTAKDLADDLGRFLEGLPIRAKRPNLLDRAGKWTRRHKLVVAYATAGLLLMVVGLAISNAVVLREQARTQAAYEQVKQAFNEAALQRSLVKRALRREAEQRGLAQGNFETARGAVDYFLDITQDKMAGQSESRELRAQMLEAGLRFYQDFIAQSQGNAPLQAELAIGHQKLARVLFAIGSTPAAQLALDKAVQTQERLIVDNPLNRQYRSRLLSMYHQLGLLRGSAWIYHLYLADNESVQDELRVTSEQIMTITELMNAHRRSSAEFIGSRGVQIVQLRGSYELSVEQTRDALARAFDDDQQKRLQQIAIQRLGIRAFDDSGVIDALGITRAQQARLQQIQNRVLHDRDGAEQSVHNIRSIEAEMRGVLSVEQIDEWRKLIGEPFAGTVRRLPWRYFGRENPFMESTPRSTGN